MAERRAVGYLRVRRGSSDTGDAALERDTRAMAAFARRNNLVLQNVFVDIHGQARARRPQFEQALAACRLDGAVLVVPRAGPLRLDPSFYEALIVSQVDFAILDHPELCRVNLEALGLKVLRADKRRDR